MDAPETIQPEQPQAPAIIDPQMDTNKFYEQEHERQHGISDDQPIQLAQNDVPTIPTADTHHIVQAPDGAKVAFPKGTDPDTMHTEMSKWWAPHLQKGAQAWDAVRHAANQAAQAVGLPSDQPEWQLATDEFMRDPIGKTGDVLGAVIGGLAHSFNSIIPSTPENDALVQRAQQEHAQGNNVAAATTLIPLVGDNLAKAVKQAQAKDFSGSVGTTVGTVLPFLTESLKAEGDLPVTREKAVPPTTTSYEHTPAQNGQFGNYEHVVTTKNAEGKTVGHLAAQDTAPGEVTIRSNQIYDEAHRGVGKGTAAIRTLVDETAKNPDLKVIHSDITTTGAARGAWEKIAEANPDTVTKEDFNGVPRWSVDLDKVREKAANAPEFNGEERRGAGRGPLMKATDIENNLKTGQPVSTPFDNTEGAMDTINRDLATRLEQTKRPTPAEDTAFFNKKEAEAKAKAQTVGTAKGAANDTALFNKAKEELGAGASISDIARRAQAMKIAGTPTPEELPKPPMEVKHWSKQGVPLTETNPEKFGTGRAGAERSRASEEGFVPRTYFGMDGYKEPAVQSGLEHKASLDSAAYYDKDADPHGIWKNNFKPSDKASAATNAERAVKEAGYSGYYSPEQQVLASFNKVPVKAARVSELQDAADAYNKQEGRPAINDRKLPKEPRQDQMAEFYKEAVHDPHNPKVVAAYDALKKDIDKQYDLGKKLGYNFEGTGTGNTYSDSYTGLKKDVFQNKNVKVWQGADFPEDHPLSEIDPKTGMRYADKLLAIHDLFGHAAHDNNFTVNGEENAWNVHRQMFSKEAQPALATETRMRGAYGAKYKEFPSKAIATPEHFQVRNEEVNGKATESLRSAVNDFNKQAGRPPMDETKIEVDPRQQEIADAYARSKHTPDAPKVKASYDAFKKDIDKQYVLAQKLGYTFDVKENDPYEGSGIGNESSAYGLLRKDAIENKHISAWKGGAPPADHPLSEVDPKTGMTYNEKLRNIHDLFGHVLPDNDFTAKGEENAWNAHRQMFSKEAEPVLATETRGQTAYQAVNNKFADQRATILPKAFRSTAEESALSDAKEMAAAHNANDGFSFNPRDGFVKPGDKAFSVAGEYPNLDQAIKGTKVTPAQIKEYVSRPEVQKALADPSNNVGGYVYNGNTILEVSKLVKDKAEAIAEGKRLNQESVFDHANQQLIKTGGTAADIALGKAGLGTTPPTPKDLWTDDTGTYTSGQFIKYLAKNKLMSKAGQETLDAASKKDFVPGWAEVSQFLTPEDRAQASKSVQKNVVDLVNKWNSEWISDAAKAGSAAKGWYARATGLIQHMFGDDAHRFTNFVASLSPQKDVEQNFTDALNFYNLWQEAGKPLGPENEKVIRDLTERAETGMSGQVARNQLYENLVNDVQPTGPKVSNFAKNLKGNMDAVTKDRWMAYLFGNNERMFRWFKEGSPKPAVHLAADALVRAVGQSINMLPAEVQETSWSFLRTVVNLTEKEKISPKEAIGRVNDQLIREGASELTRLIADSPKVQSALNRLATATGDERFRADNIQNSTRFKQLLQEHAEQPSTGGGAGAINRAGAERGVKQAIKARSEISQAKRAKEAAPAAPKPTPKKAPKDKATEFNPDDLSENSAPSLTERMKSALS